MSPPGSPPQHIKDQEATSQASNQSSPSLPAQSFGMEQLHHHHSQSAHSLHHPSRSAGQIPDIERLKLDSGPISPVPYTASSANAGILKQLDQSTNASRLASRAPSRAPSVAGIGKTAAKPDYSEAKIVVAMVGLPARGKSYLSNKLMRYLKWLEYDVKVFNVGQYRRKLAREKKATTGARDDHSASFFNPNNADAMGMREKMANDCLENLIDWLKQGGNVGIHDATNSTMERRQKLAERIEKERGMQIIFIESVCEDPSVISANVAGKVSAGDPDYNGMTPEQAEADFRRRISHYEAAYEPVNEPHISYCKVINVGEKVVCNLINGYLESRIAFYLMNLHVSPRSIFLTRHGESMFNVEGRIGGDSDLSPRGARYAQALPNLVRDNVGNVPLTLWTSTLKRTIQTASNLPYPKLTWKSLDELDAGVCDGMTYEEIEENYPEDYANRDEDKYNYRYRGGESYRDVVIRLEPIIMEMERQNNILVIGHQAILRAIYGYFHNIPQEEIPYIKIPLHTVIKLTPKAYGCDEVRYQLPIEAVDTHRPKPSVKRSDSTASRSSKGV